MLGLHVDKPREITGTEDHETISKLDDVRGSWLTI